MAVNLVSKLLAQLETTQDDDEDTVVEVADSLLHNIPEDAPDSIRVLWLSGAEVKDTLEEEENRALPPQERGELVRGLRNTLLAKLTKAMKDQANPPAGGRRSQSKKFGACVKSVRKTVKARKGSNPESAAIAICTKSMLFPRGRTIKRYRKGRLLTQKRRR